LSVKITAPVISKPGAIPFVFDMEGISQCSIVSGKAQCAVGLGAGARPAVATAYARSKSNQICNIDGKPTIVATGWILVANSETYYFPYSDYTVVESGGTACNQSFTDTTTFGAITATISDTYTGVQGTIQSLTYPNGAKQLISGGGSTGTYLQDTFGNKLQYALSPGLATWTDTLNNSAITLNLLSPYGAQYHDTTDTAQTVYPIHQTVTLKTAFGCANAPDQTVSGDTVSEVDYPDGNNIFLGYEAISGGVTGRISQVTYRTGGTTTYSYGGFDCTSFLPTTITRTTADGTTTYTRAVFTGAGGKFGTTTTVLDPGKNRTTYTYMGTDAHGSPVVPGPIPLTLTQVNVEQNTGTVASPVYTRLSRTLYCYNNNQTNCDITQAAYPIVQKDTYVSYGAMVVNSRVKETFDSFGNLLTTSRYDFGAGSPTIATTIQYGSWNGTSCVAIGNGVINKPCRVTTVGAGSTIADVTYSYLSNGFLSGENHWSGTSWITIMTASANGNGTVRQQYNSLGTPTTFSYNGVGGCNSIFPTGTSTTIGGVVLTTSATWDCNGGRLLTATDENTNQSQFTYDLMFRPYSQADPLTYQVNERYTQTTAQVFDPFISTTTTVGGFGRVNRVQTTDGASYDTTSTSYAFNANSNTQFQISTSQPCIAAVNADCTKNHFATLDPLGRVISSSTTSNETLATVYYGDATHSVFDVQTTLNPAPAGENNKVVRTEYDGLGRGKSVCEIQATGGTSCGQAMGGSGILTTFSYSFASGRSFVTQNRGSQGHTTTYDGLGRVVSVATPEAGTTTYIYDQATASCGNGTAPGFLLEIVDNLGQHTCKGYDAAGRPTNTFVAGTAAPCRVLVYGDQFGLAVLNGNNRVVEAWTDADCSGNSKITDEQFSYDKDGRVLEVWESTPHSAGQYHTIAAYYLNGALNTLSGVPGKSTYTVTLDTEGRPDSSKLGTTNLVTNVNYNAAGQTTLFAYGSSGSNDAFTFDANTGRMKTYTYTVGTATDKGTLTWNANGTLKTLAIVDGLNAGGTQACNFTYDDVSRLLTDNCGAVWSQTYTYDQYDNFSKSGSSNWNPGYSVTNNHITGAVYDGNGRATYDLNNSYSWDAYGKMASANAGASVGSCGSGGVTCVTYDAFGLPAEKQVAGAWTEFLYSPLGLTAIMSGQTTTSLRLPLPGGSTLDVAGGTNKIDHYDWLGSARLITNTGATVLMDTAYTPYGEKYASFGSGTQNFTGDFQDLYAGLFDTPNREFDQAAGSRWLSPDPAHASWNAYSYPTNPNSATDPTGLYEDMNALTPQGPSFESQVSTGCDGGYGCGAMMTNYSGVQSFDFMYAPGMGNGSYCHQMFGCGAAAQMANAQFNVDHPPTNPIFTGDPGADLLIGALGTAMPPMCAPGVSCAVVQPVGDIGWNDWSPEFNFGVDPSVFGKVAVDPTTPLARTAANLDAAGAIRKVGVNPDNGGEYNGRILLSVGAGKADPWIGMQQDRIQILRSNPSPGSYTGEFPGGSPELDWEHRWMVFGKLWVITPH
jgi:YD repeat-containing protein